MKKYLVFKDKIGGLTDVAETLVLIEKVAASKIHLLRKHVDALNEYKKSIELMVAAIIGNNSNDYYSALPEINPSRTKTLFIVAGDKGIVGSLYHDLVNEFSKVRERYQNVLVIGKKVFEYLEEEDVKAEQFFYGSEDLPGQGFVTELNDKIHDKMGLLSSSEVDILYPKFESIIEQKPVVMHFLPLNFSIPSWPAHAASSDAGLPIFEHSKSKVLSALLKKYVNVNLMEIILGEKLSELSARTVTTESAIAEANNYIRLLNISLFKERHRFLTEKQQEIFMAHKLI